MKKILHITIDDKFIGSANWQFEQIFPGSNKFYILVSNNDLKLKYVTLQPNYEILYEDEQAFNKILNEINNYDLIVFHGLDDFRCKIVLRSENKQKILWSFWGYEVYNFYKYFRNNIYGDETKRIFQKSTRRTLKRRLADSYYNTVDFYNAFYRFKALKKIGYFAFPYEEEYFSLKALKLINAKYIRFTYYPLEVIIKDYEKAYVSGNNILVGNSATMSNNHLEVFKILSKIDLDGRKIILPLSYGDNKYRDEILKLGNAALPMHLEPLTKFYPIFEYNDIIQTCSVFIMNSYRQQGIGNIFAMLWMGAKVYLDERNTTYNYLKRINCTVFSVNKDLNQLNKDAFTPLNFSEIERNREILRKELGKESLLTDLKKQIEKLWECS